MDSIRMAQRERRSSVKWALAPVCYTSTEHVSCNFNYCIVAPKELMVAFGRRFSSLLSVIRGNKPWQNDLNIPYWARMWVEYGRHVDLCFKSTVGPKTWPDYVHKIHEKFWKYGPKICYFWTYLPRASQGLISSTTFCSIYCPGMSYLAPSSSVPFTGQDTLSHESQWQRYVPSVLLINLGLQ